MTISTVKSHSIYVVCYKGGVVQEIKPGTEHKNVKVYATATSSESVYLEFYKASLPLSNPNQQF